MLSEGQEIVYSRNNGEVICRLNPGNATELLMDRNLADYIRYSQPFTREGTTLQIPTRGRIIQTSPVARIEHQNGKLVFHTNSHTTYIIEYRGIDLEGMLEEGQFNGFNALPEDKGIAPFPRLNSH